MTFDEFTTKTKELKIAIPPCLKRRRHEKITRRVLSSLLAVSKRGKVSTAVHKVERIKKRKANIVITLDYNQVSYLP